MLINNNFSKSYGFIAVVAVMIIASFSLLFIWSTFQSSVEYDDVVNHLEWRTQANINAENCLSTTAIMAVKDYFLVGDVYISDLGCFAHVIRNHTLESVSIETKAIFNGVHSHTFNKDFVIP